MSKAQTVHFYLEESLRKSAQAGEHNFINLIVDVLKEANLEPVFDHLPIKGKPSEGLSLTHLAQPPNDNGLVFRRVYHYPFWRIEAVAQRWHWDVAQMAFDPAQADTDAPRFYRYWQKRLFGDASQNARRDGYIYVPLQGKLDQQRVFQSCTPLEMIGHCLKHGGGRPVIAALHPSEKYSQIELAQLKALAATEPRLTIDTGNMVQHLQGCDFVVTQNSGVAFSGFFFGKPALLFGQIDFHHITTRADLGALGESFATVAEAAPPVAEYVWWFWQAQSINAGRPDAKEKIAARLRRFGWPVPQA